MDIEFSGRRDVASLTAGAAHENDPPDFGQDFRPAGERQRQIGERPGGDQGDFVIRRGFEGFDDEIDGVAVLKRHRGLAYLHALQPAVAMNMFRRYPCTLERAFGAGEHLDLGMAAKLADEPRVPLREVQRHVPGNGGHAQHIEFIGRRQGHGDGQGIVPAGIAIKDDTPTRHG